MDSTAGLRATRINVNEASREQIIDLLKQQRAQFRQEQGKTKELEQQVHALHELIEEKNAEITALRHQGTMLTEKAASDEETIKALIKQVEESHSSPSASAPRRFPTVTSGTDASTAGGGGTAAMNGTIVTGKVASGTSQTVSPTMTASRPPYRVPPASGIEAANNSNVIANMTAAAAAQEAAFQEKLAAASETIASKNGDIAKLETKVRELMEINAFYTAIVAQHDEEEKRQHVLAAKVTDQQPEDDVEDVPSLLQRIAALESHQEKLQRVVKQSERDKHTLLSENVQLREEATRLEMEAILAEQWAQRKDSTVTTSPALPHPSASSIRGPQTTPERVPAQVMTSPLLFGRSSPGRASGAHHQASPLALSPGTRDGNPRHRMDIRALPVIHVRNPDPQERELLDRIHLYEDYITQMENYEVDRQASFDEMERSRAELFASMNEQLEKQRRELHRLRRATLGTSNSVASLATVASLNDDAPMPRTSPDRDAVPAAPRPGVSAAVQTEATGAEEDSNKNDASNQEAEAESHHAALWREAAAALATTCVERDEAEARLRLCVDCVDDYASCVWESQAIHIRALIEAVHKPCADLHPELALPQLVQTAHPPASPHEAAEIAVRAVDDETPHHEASESADPNAAQWRALVAECDTVLHREEVSLCLDMYGDALVAYSALLNTVTAFNSRTASADRGDSDDTALNAEVLEGVQRLAAHATTPVVKSVPSALPDKVTAGEEEEEVASQHYWRPEEEEENAMPTDAMTPMDNLAAADLVAPLHVALEESMPADDRAVSGDDGAEHEEAANITNTESPWRTEEAEQQDEGPAVMDAENSSSAPDSQNASVAPSTPRDSTTGNGESAREDNHSDEQQEITPEEEAELLRQLALDAEAMDHELADGAVVIHDDESPEREYPDPFGPTSDSPAECAPLEKEGTRAESEAEDPHGQLDPAAPTEHSDGVDSSMPPDSSAPLSPTGSQQGEAVSQEAVSQSEPYDEDLHSMASHTENTSVSPDAATATEANEASAEENDEPEEVAKWEADEAEEGEAREREEETTSLPSAGASCTESRTRHSDGRPSLPPLPENCTGENVAAAIDACHQYAMSRHTSQPTTPRRGYRSVMSSNRTSASYLDSWTRNMPTTSEAQPATVHMPPAVPQEEAVAPVPAAPAWLATPSALTGHLGHPGHTPPSRVPHSNQIGAPFSVDTTSTDDEFEADFDPFR